MRNLSATPFLALMATALIAIGAPARAATTAHALYAEGDYSAAISAGEAEGGTNGFALAARAALADDELADAPCLECLLNAERLAQAAIAADESNAEAYILLVTALGRRGRGLSVLLPRNANPLLPEPMMPLLPHSK